MTFEKLNEEKEELNFRRYHWIQMLSNIENILSDRSLLQASEIDRASSVKYKIKMNLGEIEQAQRENERQIRLIALEEIELELGGE